MAKKALKGTKSKDKRGLTYAQRQFAKYYAQGETASDAVRLAGYSVGNPKAYAEKKLLTNEAVKTYITELRDQLDTDEVADANEVLRFLTEIMRGQVCAPVPTKEGVLELTPPHNIRNDAAKTLAKHHKLLVDRVEQTGSNEITITFDGDLKDWSE